MTGFNIADFRSVVDKKGIMRTNKFLVRCNIPRGLPTNALTSDLARYFEFWAESAEIPTLNIGTDHGLRYSYGMLEQRPFTQTVNDMPITFIADEQGLYWKFFRAWSDLIFNSDFTATGIAGAYELAYKDLYVSTVTIQIYSQVAEKTEPIISISLRDAFPKGVSKVNLEWSPNKEYGKFTVAFAYTDIHVN